MFLNFFLVSSVPRASHSHNDRATASNPNRTMCTEGEKGTKEGVERTKPRVLYYYYVILNMPWAANVLCYYRGSPVSAVSISAVPGLVRSPV